MLWIKRHIPCACKASEQWSSSMANHRFPSAEKKSFCMNSTLMNIYIYAFIHNTMYYCTNIEIRNEEQI